MHSDASQLRTAYAPGGPVALERLNRVALRLGLPGVATVVAEALREALPWPWDDPRYADNALVPGRPPLEVSFAETEPGTLRFDFEPSGPGASPMRRRERASDAVCQWIKACFAAPIVRDFEDSMMSLRRPRLGLRLSFGAFLGAVCDSRGLAQAKIYWELSDDLPEGFPPRLVTVASLALSAVKGLTPHFASLACGRRGCVRRLYFMCREDVPLLELRRVLAAGRLEHRLPELALRTVALLGNGLLLPAGATVFSLHEAAGRIDCKLEFLTEALPQQHAALARNLQLVLAERPETRGAFDRWVRSLGEAGPLPERWNAVGFRVSANGPARLSLYVSPTTWSTPCPP